jgi:hypothetical protein
MRPIAVLLLLAGLAAGQGVERSAAQILADHAAALGDAAKVRTLSSTSTVGWGARSARREARTYVHVPGRRFSEQPGASGTYPRREYCGPDGVFISESVLERYRPGSRATRGYAYVCRALADPVPLLPYLRNPAAAARHDVGEE